MNFFESHFWYTKRQRNGILFLTFVLILLQTILLFVDFNFSEDPQISSETYDLFQHKLDSLKKENQDNIKEYTYRFNPNYISDFKAYQLGLSVEETDRLFTFREKGKYVNSANEFQEVTGVDDSLLNKIEPLFKFPAWTQQKRSKQVAQNYEKPNSLPEPGKIKDLNTVSAQELTSDIGISDGLAKRIVAYRNKLQGFYENDQLLEVYYLDEKTADQILKYYQVINKPVIQKIDINSASFKEVLKTPYLDYKLTKRIFQYRDENLHFKNLEELKQIDSFPIEKFDRIALYLSAQ